jgi:hypothetical protein
VLAFSSLVSLIDLYSCQEVLAPQAKISEMLKEIKTLLLTIKLETNMKILAVLLSVLTSLQVAAEPSGLVRKLMKTEATMFELGLLRLERRLQRDDRLKKYHVSYDWKTNQIHISRLILVASFSKEGNQIEKFCTEGRELNCIAHLKDKLANETALLCTVTDGKCLFGVSMHFGREGFTEANFYNGKNDKDAVSQIDDISVAKISFYGRTYIVHCEKYIKSEEVKCSSKMRAKK